MRKQGKGEGRNSSIGIRRLALVGIAVAILAIGAAAAVSLRTSQAKASAAQPSNANAADARANTSLRSSAQQAPFATQTGQIKPLTQQEAQKLAEGLKQLVNQSTDGLKSVTHADGSVSIDLEGRFQSVAVAKRDENGNVVQSCVDNREAAAAFFGLDPQLVGVVVNNSRTGSTASEKGGIR